MTPLDLRRLGRVPRAVLVACWVGLVGATVQVFAGGWLIGSTYDEAYHVERFRHYLASGWYLIDGQTFHGRPGPGVTDQYVYGPATMWLLHGWCRLLGVEGPGQVAATAHAYAVRHLAIGLISLLGLYAVAATGREIFRRWDWGVVAAAVVGVTPMWTGHAMFNLKDISVATGYALVTLALVRTAAERPDSRWQRLGTVLWFAAGLVLCVGTRPGMWSGMLASLVAVVVLCAVRPRAAEPAYAPWGRVNGGRLADLAVGLVLAAAVLVWMYPKVFTHPVRMALESAHASVNYRGYSSPWAYVPIHVGLQVPLLILALTGYGLAVAVRQLVRTGVRPGVQESHLALVLVQMLTLPLVAMLNSSSLYGDLRQLLFAMPATALVAAVGLARLLERARVGWPQAARRVAPGIACVAVLLPMLDQATLFPFNYTYYNVLAKGLQSKIYGDFYRAGGRAIAPEVPRGGRVVCGPDTTSDGDALFMQHLDGTVDCGTFLVSPLSPYNGERTRSGPTLGPDDFYALVFGGTSGKVPPNCRPGAQVTRRQWWRELTIVRLARCHLAPTTLPPGGVSITGESDSWTTLRDGWYLPTVDGHRTGTRSMGGPSSLAFRAPSGLRGRSATLLVRTRERVLPRAEVNGRQLGAHPAADGFTLALAPAETRGAIRVTFGSGTGRRLELSLLSLRMEARS